MQKKKKYVMLFGVIAVLLCGVFYVYSNDRKADVSVDEHFAGGDGDEKREGFTGDSSTVRSGSSQSNDITGESGQEKSQTKVYIDISGEVKKPGVYIFDCEPRLVEVVKRAGGLTKKADSTAVNQAKTVEDGTQIVIPSKTKKSAVKKNSGGAGSSGGAGTSSQQNSERTSDGKVNINTATKEQLMTLSGVGEARAEDILSYREKQGEFKKIEDIMEVSGIKEGIFKQIKDKIVVG